MRAVLVGLAAVLLLTSCGQDTVVDAVPQAPPYEGPLYVPASLVVDCDSPSVGYAEDEPYEDSVSRSPTAALQRGLRQPNRGATSGLRETRRDADRVLYTYEVDGRTKQAMIVHRGRAIDGRTGWYVESWARCDWSELPPALAEGLGIQVWEAGTGRRIPTSRVSSSRGPEHCGWQHMTFLALDGGDLEDGESYVDRPAPEYYPVYFTVPYGTAAVLPADARDTGYERDGRQLWLAPDHSRAFVGTPDSVDVWPRVVQPMGCA